MKARAIIPALATLLLLAAPAQAVIHPPSVIDGPSNDILEMDGAAMARDGSGGVVYRKDVAGVAHVFVAPFANGAWQAPVEVDYEDQYGASQPAIAAAEGGRLLVVWVQPRNVSTSGITLYELMSASLQPGASSFGPATIVDPNVGEPFTGDARTVDPSLAMAPNGEAYVVYRVVGDECTGEDPASSSCPPASTDELVQVRVARFNFGTWSSLGAVNRAPQIAMRAPVAANAPVVGIDLAGEGLVAWQEPEASGGAARIWVRRLFGVVQGNVLEASPETVAGKSVTSDAEAPAIGMGPYGEACVAFRVHGEPGSAVPTTQLYVNSIASSVGLNASQLKGPVAVSGAVGPEIGSPSAGIDADGAFRVTWPQGASMEALSGTPGDFGNPAAIGANSGQVAPTTLDPAGGDVTAWQSLSSGVPAVAVREDYPQGTSQLAQFGGNIAGPISDLSFGGSGRGDALVGWTVGEPGRSEVVADFVQAPPAPFDLILPLGWVAGGTLPISWEPAPDAVLGTTYTVYVDGEPRASGLTTLSTSLYPGALGTGVHHVQVLAIDPSGQRTLSGERELSVDVSPPTVQVTLIDHGRGVRVTVRDSASGVDAAATAISFGDGHRSTGHARVQHRYGRGGNYVITAEVRDNVGNAATIHIRVETQ